MKTSDIRVLCVDDHAETATLLERQLSEQFDVRVVASAAAAVECLAHDSGYAVIVSDYLMPERDGIDLLGEVARRWPQVVRVMITAVDELDIAIAALHDGRVYRFVRKPWAREEILHAVSEAANYYRLMRNERRLREQLAQANAELDEKVRDLDEANELLEYWVEFSPAVLYSLSCEGGDIRPSYISKNFKRLTGYERTDAVIEAGFYAGIIIADDRARYLGELRALAAGEQIVAVTEYTLIHNSGDTVRVVDSLRAVQDAFGDTVEIVGAWMDVTARH